MLQQNITKMFKLIKLSQNLLKYINAIKIGP